MVMLLNDDGHRHLPGLAQVGTSACQHQRRHLGTATSSADWIARDSFAYAPNPAIARR
jgi:hypothetical protein